MAEVINSNQVAKPLKTGVGDLSPLDGRQKIYIEDNEQVNLDTFKVITEPYPHMRIHVHKKQKGVDGSYIGDVCIGVYEVDEIDIVVEWGEVSSASIKSYHQVYSTSAGASGEYTRGKFMLFEDTTALLDYTETIEAGTYVCVDDPGEYHVVQQDGDGTDVALEMRDGGNIIGLPDGYSAHGNYVIADKYKDVIFYCTDSEGAHKGKIYLNGLPYGGEDLKVGTGIVLDKNTKSISLDTDLVKRILSRKQVTKPTISNKVYNGQKIALADTADYTVYVDAECKTAYSTITTSNTNYIYIGTYILYVKLNDNEKTQWNDYSDSILTLKASITAKSLTPTFTGLTNRTINVNENITTTAVLTLKDSTTTVAPSSISYQISEAATGVSVATDGQITYSKDEAGSNYSIKATVTLTEADAKKYGQNLNYTSSSFTYSKQTPEQAGATFTLAPTSQNLAQKATATAGITNVSSIYSGVSLKYDNVAISSGEPFVANKVGIKNVVATFVLQTNKDKQYTSSWTKQLTCNDGGYIGIIDNTNDLSHTDLSKLTFIPIATIKSNTRQTIEINNVGKYILILIPKTSNRKSKKDNGSTLVGNAIDWATTGNVTINGVAFTYYTEITSTTGTQGYFFTT